MADTYVHFEIPADDPEVLMSFYTSAFGWSFQHTPMPGMPDAEYILIQTADEGQPGLPGGMFKRFGPDDKPRNFLGVSSIDDTLRNVEAAGGKVTQPKMAVPNIGWAAFVTDPEGNLQGVFQDDSNAK